MKLKTQDREGNNCGIHSLLRLRDELEMEEGHDTDEHQALDLRRYLTVARKFGYDKYPMKDIFN